jgi:hypothetical protein
MKISFLNCSSGAGISIRTVIKALLKWHKPELAHTAHRKKSVPQITSGWDYRPKQATRRYAAVASPGPETAEALRSSSLAINEHENVWFNFIDSGPTAEDARGKAALFQPMTVNNSLCCSQDWCIDA